MNQTKEDQFSLWNELSNLVGNHTFSYIDNYEYDELISKALNDIYKLLLQEDISSNFNNYLQKNYSKEHALIFEIIEDILSEKKFNHTLSLNVPLYKKIIEDALNLLSVQLIVSDYEYPSKNDYSKLIIKLLPMNKQDNYSRNNDELSMLKQKILENNNNEYIKHVNERLSIHIVHNNNYDEIIKRGLYIWRDPKNLNLYYRVEPLEEKIKTDKVKLTNYLCKVLNKYIDIHDSTDDIIFPESDYLIISLLPIVKTDIFNPNISFEFYQVDSLWYRNTFVYTNYLLKRINNISNQYYLSSKIDRQLKSFYYKIDYKDGLLKRLSKFQLQIEKFPLEFKQPTFNRYGLNNQINDEKYISITKFIFFLSKENNDVFNYIMNWLAYFFQKLEKSHIALVLLGDMRVSEEIFFSQIVEEIFGFTYCASINDNDLETESISQIVEDKIFFHIGDLNNKISNGPKAKKLLRTILIDKVVKPDRTLPVQNKVIPIYGQTLITSHKPSPYIKDSYSKCTVVKVDDLENILIKLNLPDPASLDAMIKADLEDFSNILAQYPVHDQFANYALETEDRYPPVKTIDANTLDKNIQDFIEAIKSKKISYFEPIKAINSVLYDELIHNFSEGMIARQELFSYFDMLNPGSDFSDNKDFLAILRDKDPFFMQNIDNNKQYNKKKRYRIGTEVFE